MHGFGKYTSSEGIYLGEFRNGVRDGMGRLTLVEGTYLTVWKFAVKKSAGRKYLTIHLNHPFNCASLLFLKLSD